MSPTPEAPLHQFQPVLNRGFRLLELVRFGARLRILAYRAIEGSEPEERELRYFLDDLGEEAVRLAGEVRRLKGCRSERAEEE